MKISKKSIERVDMAYQRWAEWILNPIPQLGWASEVAFHPAIPNSFQEKAAEDIRSTMKKGDAKWIRGSSSRPKQKGHGCMYMPNHYMKEVDLVYSTLPEQYQWAINGKYLTPKKDYEIAEALEISPPTFSRLMMKIYTITAKKLEL